MMRFIDENVVADGFKEVAFGSIMKRGIKNLCCAFYDDDGDGPEFHAAIEVTYLSEKRIAPISFQAGLPDFVEVCTQVAAMLLFFFDEKFYGIHVFRIIDLFSIR